MDSGPDVLHVTGEVAGSAQSAPSVDLAALRDRMTVHRAPEPFDGRVFTFGPRWENATRVSFVSDDDRSEKLISLALPERFLPDLATHLLHPALLDTALSSARDPERDDVFIPFMYRSAIVYEPLPAEFDSYIVRRPAADGLILADIQLIAKDGRLLAQFDGFTMRHTTREHLKDVENVSGTQHNLESRGIDPDVGVRLLLELLDLSGPRQIAIRPFRNGQPVPLDAEPAGARTSAEPRQPTHEARTTAGHEAAPDRAAPGLAAAVTAGPGRAAAGTIADQLAAIWASALGRTDIGVDDDFFDLGGNSLSAIDLMALIRAELGVELSIATLFDYPTIGALSEALRSGGITQ